MASKLLAFFNRQSVKRGLHKSLYSCELLAITSIPKKDGGRDAPTSQTGKFHLPQYELIKFESSRHSPESDKNISGTKTMSSPLSKIEPVNPVAPYIGGKRLLAKRVIARIESIDHGIYCEPFVGMGGIFLRRSLIPKSEIINDWSDDVSNFFRILQHHYIAFMDMIRYQITSRSGFEKLKSANPDSLTDLQRAARFLYLQRLAFGGRVDKRNFGVAAALGARFNISKLEPMLESLHERLAGVVIERMQWDKFIERYDRDATLFYLDPPYYGCETDYGDDMFDRSQFVVMADVLSKIKGRFILSINDHIDIRDIFADFKQEAVTTKYSTGSVKAGDKRKDVGELIISN